MTKNKKMLEFLKELVSQIENDEEMDPVVIKELGEFYLRAKFLVGYKIKPTRDEDIIKYVSAGYFIYNQHELVDAKQETSDEEENAIEN